MSKFNGKATIDPDRGLIFEESRPTATEPLSYEFFEIKLEGQKVFASDRGYGMDNIGTIMVDNGDSCLVEFVSPDGCRATKDVSKTELKLMDGTPLVRKAVPQIESLSFDKLLSSNPSMRPPIIEGLLRDGETMNVIAATKVGKSWLAADLAMSMATGNKWLKKFETKSGPVAYVDNELHPETLASRFGEIAKTRGYDRETLSKNFHTFSLRGSGIDLAGLEILFDASKVKPQMIVLDALYRFIPAGVSENDNAQMMGLFNTLDRYAKKFNTAFVVIHHASKGDQSGKSITDVGSGAGAMSRAADTHLIIRPHEEDGFAVLEGATRSFPAPEPLTMFFTWPLWHVDATRKPHVRQRQSAHETKKIEQRKQDVKIVAEEFSDGEFSWPDVRKLIGCGQDRATGIIAFGVQQGIFEKGEIVRRSRSTKETQQYKTTGTPTGTPTGTDH